MKKFRKKVKFGWNLIWRLRKNLKIWRNLIWRMPETYKFGGFLLKPPNPPNFLPAKISSLKVIPKCFECFGKKTFFSKFRPDKIVSSKVFAYKKLKTVKQKKLSKQKNVNSCVGKKTFSVSQTFGHFFVRKFVTSECLFINSRYCEPPI